jgi:hypothetical protein
MNDTDNPHQPPQPPNAQPLRRLTLWLPDTRTPGFAAEARRQSQQVAQQGADEDHVLDLLEDDTSWADQ